MKKIITLSLLSGILMTKSYAQDPDTTARHFLIMASIGNIQEVSAGKLAAQKATRADIKSFGEMMVKDYSEAEKKLLKLARERGYEIPADVTEPPQPDPHLVNASGDDFDRIYIHAMVPDHGSAVMMFENYATTGKDPEVRAFAKEMLPTLKEHLATIKGLDEKYKNLTAK